MNRFNMLVIGGLLAAAMNAALLSGVSAGQTAITDRDVMNRILERIAIALQQDECVQGQGFWKNNPDAWPVDELMLGDVTYTQDELLDILNQPPRGNGLVILARQLIGAKLNIADGANTPDDIHDAIDDADALIGDLVVPPVGDDWLHPSETGELSDMLAAYNDGELHDEDCELIEPDE
jgi:hypothetical protein